MLNYNALSSLMLDSIRKKLSIINTLTTHYHNRQCILMFSNQFKRWWCICSNAEKYISKVFRKISSYVGAETQMKKRKAADCLQHACLGRRWKKNSLLLYPAASSYVTWLFSSVGPLLAQPVKVEKKKFNRSINQSKRRYKKIVWGLVSHSGVGLVESCMCLRQFVCDRVEFHFT